MGELVESRGFCFVALGAVVQVGRPRGPCVLWGRIGVGRERVLVPRGSNKPA